MIGGRIRSSLSKRCALSSLLCVSMLVSTAYAITPPTSFPGFEGGALLQGRGIRYSSPLVAELDGNTANGNEIAIVTPNAVVNVIRSDGSLLWTKNLPNYSCSGTTSGNKAYGAPAAGNLYGDGVTYLVVPYGGLGARRCDGGVVVYRASDGVQKWKFSTQANSRRFNYGSAMFGVFGTPGLADVDGDGDLEVGFGSFDRNVYLLNSNGSLRWFYHAADTVWGSPTFANVDSNPDLEMILATDISRNDRLNPPTRNGGFVYAFKTTNRAKNKKRVGFRNTQLYVWQTYLDQSLFSSPVVADVLPSNPGEEVIIQSGCYFRRAPGDYYGDWVKVLDAATGIVLQTLDASACSPASPVVADIDNDDQLEVIASSSGTVNLGGDGYSRLTAWKAESNTPLWSVIPYGIRKNDPNGGHFHSPIVADLDCNGSLEVALMNNGGVAIVQASDGTQLSCPDLATPSCEGLGRFNVGQSTNNSPAIADLDNDGTLELIAGGGNSSTGRMFVWTNFVGNLGSADGEGEECATPWPTWRKNVARTAR